jgi:predicted naringenin-chalcone synthase
LDIDRGSGKVQGSYEILKNYGNLSSASTGFMLSQKTDWAGPIIVVGFGVGFAASAGVMSLN